jgi:hypothetical protein
MRMATADHKTRDRKLGIADLGTINSGMLSSLDVRWGERAACGETLSKGLKKLLTAKNAKAPQRSRRKASLE